MFCLPQEIMRIPSTSISFSFKGRGKFVEVCIRASDVPIKYLDNLDVKIRKTLKKLLKRRLDMESLHAMVDQNELSVRTHSGLFTSNRERVFALVET
jgi:hypothetical protein